MAAWKHVVPEEDPVDPSRPKLGLFLVQGGLLLERDQTPERMERAAELALPVSQVPWGISHRDLDIVREAVVTHGHRPEERRKAGLNQCGPGPLDNRPHRALCNAVGCRGLRCARTMGYTQVGGSTGQLP